VFLHRQRAADPFAVPVSGAITTAVEPIVSLATGQVLGVEALSRFVPADRGAPQDWFSDAARAGRTVHLELRAAVVALDAAAAPPVPGYVAVNFSPATLLWSGLARLLSSLPIHPSRIVVELTEHTTVPDYARLARALRPLRNAGIRLAVDDAGARQNRSAMASWSTRVCRHTSQSGLSTDCGAVFGCFSCRPNSEAIDIEAGMVAPSQKVEMISARW
jgi:EAL domain-containing protein (putative c-di-GMP-specific phosphodiesterase class I)